MRSRAEYFRILDSIAAPLPKVGSSVADFEIEHVDELRWINAYKSTMEAREHGAPTTARAGGPGIGTH